MEFFRADTHIDFMGKRQLMAMLLAVLIATSLGAIIFRGLVLGLDFTGGTLIEVSYTVPVELTDIRAQLSQGGFADAVVQHFGSPRDVMVRLAPRGDEDNAQLSNRVLAVLQESSSEPVEMRRVEHVGAQIGEELTEQGGLAMLFALIGILIYVALRFEWRFALGAVLATVHDTVFTLGFFALFGIEFDLTVLAALLAVIGYSLNDTIVVFDRIRENIPRRRGEPYETIVNRSLLETIHRSLATQLNAIFVLIALLIFGGATMKQFVAVLLVGLMSGTYSSIFNAVPLLVVWETGKLIGRPRRATA
jgi:preprotein translocase subunit SecF